ncbi:MAG: hypothetical protein ACTFAK_16810 [Candidatus Electronema sp. VV]
MKDRLMEIDIQIMPLRKKNLKIKRGCFIENDIKFVRNGIKSAFSVIKHALFSTYSRCHASGV